MAKLAIFDLDGTLLDTLTDLANACNYALGAYGFPPHETDAYKLFVGEGAYTLIFRALPAQYRDDETIRSVRAAFDEHYTRHAQDKTEAYPGIVDALKYLRAHGVKIAVLSNKPHGYTESLVQEYFPGLVDVAFGQREGVPIKPDPVAVFEILDQFGYAKEECVYIGDTGVDMQTGNRAGLATIGVLWGFRTKDELQKSGASVIIDKVELLRENIVDKSFSPTLY